MPIHQTFLKYHYIGSDNMQRVNWTQDKIDFIIEQYTSQQMNTYELASYFGCSNDTIGRRLKENDIQPRKFSEDLTGKTFGKLYVLKKSPKSARKIFWECQCECGNIITVVGDSLRQNHTMSCGKCQFKSKGEFIITQLLKNNNIDFQREYTFPDLVTHYHNMKYRFDFAIFNNQQLKYLIEFDGPQHSKTSGTWFNEDKLKIIQNNDKKKEQYCIDNQIPLIRIPYSHLYKICLDDLILETTIYRKV